MMAATRDFLAILVSEIAVERVFSTVRDLLEVRRYRIRRDIIRILILIK